MVSFGFIEKGYLGFEWQKKEVNVYIVCYVERW